MNTIESGAGAVQYAVIGDPIAHSLSPQMHNAAFAFLGIDAVYRAVRVEKENLASFMEDAKKHLAGFNVTVPHKNNILPFLDGMSKTAELARSVNTVVIRPGGTAWGETTDGYGMENAVREAGGPSLSGAEICILGCGGVVPALAFHAAFAGAKSIRIVNRTLDKARELCLRLQNHFPALECHCSDAAGAREMLSGANLVLQCTSLGLREEDPAPVAPELLPAGIFLFDTIYKNTKLLAFARTHGIPCADGLSMLLHQGARAFQIWTKREPPVEVMRKALLSARGGTAK